MFPAAFAASALRLAAGCCLTLVSGIALTPQRATAATNRPEYTAPHIENWHRIYPQSLADLQPGDVLFYRAYDPHTGALTAEGSNLFARAGDAVVGLAISAGTGAGPYRHVAMYLGDGLKAESMAAPNASGSPAGGQINPITSLNGVEIFRNTNSVAAAAAARDAAALAPAFSYDIGGIASFAFRLFSSDRYTREAPIIVHHSDAAICSDFVNRILSAHGIGIVDAAKLHDAIVSPNYMGYALGKQHLLGRIGAAIQKHVWPIIQEIGSTPMPFSPHTFGRRTAPGGVWFANAARVIGDLGRIDGAVYTEKGLVLVGDDGRATNLPPLNLRDFAAILRLVYEEKEPLLFSLDPDPRNPSGPELLVRYLGGLQDTPTGLVPLNADYMMKALSMGVDPRTNQGVASNVAGYANQLALSLAARPDAKDAIWNRFWLTTEEQGIVLRVTPDRRAVALERAQIVVKTERMTMQGGQLVSAASASDPRAEYFARWLTENYDAVAREFPVFEELRQLAVLVGIAKWMKEANLAPDLSWTAEYEEHIATPRTVPAMTAQKTASQQAGNQIVTRTVSVYGGVGEMHLFQARDDGKATALASAVDDALVTADGPRFHVSLGGTNRVAALLPVDGSDLGSYSTAHTDLVLRVGDVELPITRSFNSFHTESTPFGRGWSFNLPHLQIWNPEARGERQLSVEGVPGSQVNVRHFRLRDAFGWLDERFTEPTIDQAQRRIFLAPHRPDSMFLGIYPQSGGDYLLRARDGSTRRFSPDGRIAEWRNGNFTVRYEWGNGRLGTIALTAPGGSSVASIAYDAAGRVAGIHAGAMASSYEYSPTGELQAVAMPLGKLEYAYNASHLPTHVWLDRNLVWQGAYDELGRLIESGVGAGSARRVRSRDGDATIIRVQASDTETQVRVDGEGKVLTAEGSFGRAAFGYGSDGVVREMNLTGPAGARSWRVSRDDRHLTMQDGSGTLAYGIGKGGEIRRIDADGQFGSIVMTLLAPGAPE